MNWCDAAVLLLHASPAKSQDASADKLPVQAAYIYPLFDSLGPNGKHGAQYIYRPSQPGLQYIDLDIS